MDTEIARRNYALTAETYDTDFLLRISCGEETLATVCDRVSESGDIEEFAVYRGTGLDDQENEDESAIVKKFTVDSSVEDTWRAAVRFAYLFCLSSMMMADSREESVQ